MKICHLNYHAISGGGAIAAMRLHMALKQQDINSIFLAVEPEGNPEAIGIATEFERKRLLWKQKLIWGIYQLQRSKNRSAHSFDIFPSGFVPRVLAHKPDIVHLHIINGEMFSIKEIADLCSKVRVIWTLHDCWPFAGTEQYPLKNGNNRYLNGYYSGNKEDIGIDLDKFFWRKKFKYLKNASITYVAPSKWIANEARKSVILSSSPINLIHHGINLDIFKPGEKLKSRQQLNLPSSGLLIGFAASHLDNKIKGKHILIELGKLIEKNCIEKYGKKYKKNIIMIFSGQGDLPKNINNIKIIGIGSKMPNEMPDFYKALDMFISPSCLESFGLTNLEAQACGCPVLAFDSTGIKDVVKHKVSGYLAFPEDVNDLYSGFQWISAQDQEKISSQARQWAATHFSSITWAKKHYQLYQSLLQ